MITNLWHGSALPRTRLTAGKDGGVHLGTRAQAEMRNPAFLHRADLLIDTARVKRSKDSGGQWANKIRLARARGADAIVYLNRFEGLSIESVDAVAEHADAPDSRFRALAPDAQDSYISLDESSVKVREIIAGTGVVTLYHGTSIKNAADLCAHGFHPDRWRVGPSGGRRGLLYVTDVAENAEWFAEQHGERAVLELRVRACDLIVDPEDGIGKTVVEEMTKATKLPAYLATRKPISPMHIRPIATPNIPELSPSFR